MTAVHGSEDAERIVDAFGTGREVIAVVQHFQLPAGSVVGEMLGCSQILYAFLHVSVNLSFRQAAQTSVLREHGYVFQVVEVAEDADFAEFCDSGQHREPDMPVHGLEHSVEGL